MLHDVTKEKLEARLALIKAIRELIIREYADFQYEEAVALHQEQMRDALNEIHVRVEEARAMNSPFYAKILQALRILPKLSEDPKDYEYLKPEAPVKQIYNEEFEKQQALADTGIFIKANRRYENALYCLPSLDSNFDASIEFAFDFAIKHLDSINTSKSIRSYDVRGLWELSTFTNGELSIDLGRQSYLWAGVYDVVDYRERKEFLLRVKQNVVPKLEEVGVDCFPFITALEIIQK